MNSPFEEWRLREMRQIAVTPEILELIAKGFEGGRLAERKMCAEEFEEYWNSAGLQSSFSPTEYLNLARTGEISK